MVLGFYVIEWLNLGYLLVFEMSLFIVFLNNW